MKWILGFSSISFFSLERLLICRLSVYVALRIVAWISVSFCKKKFFWVILVVPFLIYEDVTIIQNEEPITKYSLPWLKTTVPYGWYEVWIVVWMLVGGEGGGYRSGRMWASFFVIPSPVQTCDIPLGEVSFTALQCGLNKFMTCYFSFW